MRQQLLATDIPTILGGEDKLFYRVATGDVDPPYVTYHVPQLDADTDVAYLQEGELIFDIWDYSTSADRALTIKDILLDLFNRAHMATDGGIGVRTFFNGDREAPIENNRSNRRSENERMFRREVSFDLRGFDSRAARARLDNTEAFPSDFYRQNRIRYTAVTGSLTPAADGVRTTFNLPEAADAVYSYSVNGVASSAFTRVGDSQIETTTPPTAGAVLTVRYIPT